MRSLSSILLIVSAFFISSGLAIKCYHCNSHFNKSCDKSNGLESYLTDCSELADGWKYTVCRKIDQDMPNHDGVEDKVRTIRECGTDDPVTNTCYQKAGFGGRQYVCSCDTDGCNSGTHMKAVIGTLLSFALAALMGPNLLL